MDTFVVVELYVCTYEERRLLIGFEFGAIDTLGFEDGKKFSAKALSYGFPRLDIDGVMLV